MFFSKLKVVSYVVLVLGAIGCLIMFFNLSTVSVGLRTEFSPLGFFSSLAATIGVVLSFFSLYALAVIGENTEATNSKLWRIEKQINAVSLEVVPEKVEDKIMKDPGTRKPLLERLKNQ